MSLFFGGNAESLSRIVESASEEHQPLLMDALAVMCKSLDEHVSIEAASALLRLSEDIDDVEIRGAALRHIVSLNNLGSGEKARQVKREASENLKACERILALNREIEDRCAAICALQKKSRLSNRKVRLESSIRLIERSRESLPEVRMVILSRLVLDNMMPRNYRAIARRAAKEIVNFCLEKKEGQPEGERLRRIEGALCFFRELPYSTYMFSRQINELDAAKLSGKLSTVPPLTINMISSTPLWSPPRSRNVSSCPCGNLGCRGERPMWMRNLARRFINSRASTMPPANRNLALAASSKIRKPR